MSNQQQTTVDRVQFVAVQTKTIQQAVDHISTKTFAFQDLEHAPSFDCAANTLSI